MRYCLVLGSPPCLRSRVVLRCRGRRYESTTIGASSTLTIDVVPLYAEVRLDGVSLGTAHELISQAVAVTPGKHVVEIGAPGFFPSTVTVVATVDWATRVWLQLIPERR